MSLHSEENAVSRQLDSLAAAEPSSAPLSGVSHNNLSPIKQLDTYPAGREVLFVCAYYGPISFNCSSHSP